MPKKNNINLKKLLRNVGVRFYPNYTCNLHCCDREKLKPTIPLQYIQESDFKKFEKAIRSNESLNDLIHTQEEVMVSETKKAIKLIRLLGELGLRRIVFSGGDPTMHPDIISIIKAAAQHIGIGDKNSPGSVEFITNGISTNLPLIAKYADKVGISLHGCKYASWSEFTKGMPAQFDLIWKNIELLSKTNVHGRTLKVELRYVLDNKNSNSEEIRRILEYCHEKGYSLRFYEKFDKDSYLRGPDGILKITTPLDFIRFLSEEVALPKQILSELKLIENVPFRGQIQFSTKQSFKYRNVTHIEYQRGYCHIPGSCEQCYRTSYIKVNPALMMENCTRKGFPMLDIRDAIDRDDSKTVENAILLTRLAKGYKLK